MADRTLEMAGASGLTADRIVATQIIRSDNLKAVVDAVLLSRQHAIPLIKR